MNIVVLDGYTLNPGDLDWQPLVKIAKQGREGQFHCYDRTSEAELISRASGADIIFTNKTPITAETLSQLPNLKYIGVLATGTNVVDLNCARERGVAVTNVPGYGPDAVAQMVFAHILHHTQRVSIHHSAVSEGKWTDCEDFCFTLAPLQSLQGKTLGLMGYGAIGRQVANIALAFGMKVLVNTRTEPLDLPPGVKWAAFDSMIPRVDILSLHCPLTEATDKIINRTVLEKMRSSAILINTARGGLIDEAALKQALDEGEIAAAGVDVLSTEPPQADNPLLNAVNISISPHNSWATREARQNLLNIAIGNLQAFLSEKPRNRVN
ncbi:D-isomer specific 2-hydroxyacid dehydrogenase, NAD-binding [Shewanella sediminis HAW-EB3]|uniref:D-isomer specific 2-hydroxyacid dehydrogenase, NAD-binding n=1 Tax=Shewanella sediminis (strain HAW-EB3) TaxID=425104 RepID=A8FRW0_SHESH|nr:D-2-hydroxyacid dehydrogenase [Shewanella sediminis]ABV35583.1 D-isomer specific 2-hydroxyacid dehydrogenase, NAD-binding [Shewanella sediminis HAW-EB3]